MNQLLRMIAVYGTGRLTLVSAPRYLFIAGGIGITPFMAMMMQLTREDLPFELHYAIRSRSHGAYWQQLLDRYGTGVTISKLNLQAVAAPEAVNEAFQDVVESVSPGPYLELFARRQRLGWATWGNEALCHVELVTPNNVSTTPVAEYKPKSTP